MTTKATPLSAVSTTREESSLRVLMASFSCLVMLRVGPEILANEIDHLNKVHALQQLPPVDDQTVRKNGETRSTHPSWDR